MRAWFSEWTNLLYLLVTRSVIPLRSPTFVIYFAVVMVILGGMGFWIPVFQYLFPLQTPTMTDAEGKMAMANAIAAYLMAVAASAFADVILKDAVPAFRMCSFAITATAMLLGIVAVTTTSPDRALVTSVIGAIMSVLLWWLVNYDSDHLRPRSDASTGGDPAGLPAGSLKGLTT